MPITNRQGVSDGEFSAAVAQINEGLDHTQFASATRQEYIKNNIKEIKVNSETGVAPVIEGNVLIVGKDITVGEVRSVFNTWLIGLSITMLNQSNKEAYKHA